MKKGFTLIELLIVIGILAILTAAVVVVLNPAELLKQARDSQRLSDIDAIKNALALYLSDVSSPSIGTTTNCYAYTGTAANCTVRFESGTLVTSSAQTVAGAGWIPVNLSAISSGAPLSKFPIDPTNDTTYYYAYKADATNLTFEINAALESTKYASKATSDGGNATSYYESGTDPGLDL